MKQTTVFNPDLVRRFDVPGPRYTSYPTADRFTDAFNASSLEQALARRAGKGPGQPLSLYFHIPFCNTICYYCACNKIITKDRSLAARYIDYLGREMAMQSAVFGTRQDVVQMHWGGGTPTFLSADEIRLVMSKIREHFNIVPEGEHSIEIDPRKVSDDIVALLRAEGFNRMSLGVQDFDPVVQKAVNRIQTLEETRAVIDAARRYGFKSVSVDLIYGLPHQTVDRFSATLDHVLSMSPDRLSIYNYAHLPTRFMPQRRINAEDLPSADEKLQIFGMAINKLSEAGYVYIGMDHFAKPDDELAMAQREGFLHRNFQGYSTHAECDLMAFGVSAIGKIGPSFSQNAKDLEGYYGAIDEGRLPVIRGWECSEDDTLRNAVIQALMCHFELSFAAFNERFGIDFRSRFAPELEQLKSMEGSGLVQVGEGDIVVTEAGRFLVRGIAMVFDHYLRTDQEKRRYSKVI